MSRLFCQSKYEDFVKRARPYARRILGYHNLSNEEINQEIALAYFTVEDISELDFKDAISRVCVLLRKESGKYSNTGRVIRSNKEYVLEEKDLNDAAYLLSIDGKSTDGLLDVINFLSRKDFEFMMDFVNEGVKFASIKYSMTENYTKTKFYRLKKRIKKEVI